MREVIASIVTTVLIVAALQVLGFDVSGYLDTAIAAVAALIGDIVETIRQGVA